MACKEAGAGLAYQTANWNGRNVVYWLMRHGSTSSVRAQYSGSSGKSCTFTQSCLHACVHICSLSLTPEYVVAHDVAHELCQGHTRSECILREHSCGTTR